MTDMTGLEVQEQLPSLATQVVHDMTHMTDITHMTQRTDMSHLEVQEQLPGLAAQVAALGDGDEPGLHAAGSLQDETHLEGTRQGDMEDEGGLEIFVRMMTAGRGSSGL